MKRAGATAEEEQALAVRRAEMKQLYEEELLRATEEDRERASLVIRLDMSPYNRR